MFMNVFFARGVSQLASLELSIAGMPVERQLRRLRQGSLLFLLLVCALFNCSCADDSTTDNQQHRQHRHGHGRDQSATVDRWDNNVNPQPNLNPPPSGGY